MHGPSMPRWAGPTRLARPLLLILALAAVAPVGPTLAQDEPIDAVDGCVTVTPFAASSTLHAAPEPEALAAE